MMQAAGSHGLVAEGISLGFGGLQVLSDVSMTLRPGVITGLIGPNGAGKTSLFNCLTGLYHGQRGISSFDGMPLNGLGPAQRAACGITRSFQNLAMCPDLSLLENVLVGLTLKRRSGWFSAFVPTPAQRMEQQEAERRAMAALNELGIASAAHETPSDLPPGTLRLAEIARAIVSEPRAILLDEPAAGLNAVETRDLMRALKRLMRSDLVLLVVEHDMDLIMELCEQIYVLNFGKMIANGTPVEIRAHPDVIRVYLGDDADD
ncbi:MULTISPECIES: ABC transporter ATP-binding protein [Bradyrhizobium]|uniref:ABC transporter ATP-binding protein n=1 Tax=Bradyrhizobium TaxID=374 RepID=UPI00040EC379|nr:MULTISPECIES: ABC transporter ATP-binding protein [Bradyrhizobium]QOG21988.1 ATP-binding cassette domain-containing protein [Bradyrhizobium sp. SEMIA]UFW48086.1 ABC transporter ATP-binding protein [Bradyrhizobium arachidis]